MYRLIAPIVDFANASGNYHVHFEYTQTSAHNTSQAVDIALLENSKPVVMIEAKRIGRKISSEQISKYLTAGVRGIVTNGACWILSFNDKSKAISIVKENNNLVDPSSIDEIVEFIQCLSTSSEDWTHGKKYIASRINAIPQLKSTKGTRKSNTSCITSDINSMRNAIFNLDTPSQLDRLLIESMMNNFEEHGRIPSYLRTEVRCSRIVFFDNRIKSGSSRVARIKLGRAQSDVLLLTTMVSRNDVFTKLAQSEAHDKGGHMRKYRLSSEEQAKLFGEQLAILLISDDSKNAA